MSDSTQPIRFGEELPLWPEVFEYAFLLDLNEEEELFQKAVLNAKAKAGPVPCQDDVDNCAIYTSHHMLVEALEEECSGLEIAFRLTYIPLPPDEQS